MNLTNEFEYLVVVFEVNEFIADLKMTFNELYQLILNI